MCSSCPAAELVGRPSYHPIDYRLNTPRSSTIRNELHARPIILWWYLLASVGFFCALVGLWYGWQNPIIPDFDWGMCDPARPVNVTELEDSRVSWIFVDLSFIQKYNCTNPCNSGHVQHRTQFRGRDSLLLLNEDQTWGKTHNRQFETFVGSAIKTSFIALPIVVVQGLLTLVFGEKTQHEVRNSVFRFFAGQRKSWRLGSPIRLRPWRKYSAQCLALLSYALAVLALAFCPLLYLFNIVAIEMTLTDYHDSEDPWMVGQWSPVVGALLVLMAATLSKYWECWTSLTRHWLFGSKADGLRRRHHTGALTRPSARHEEPDIARNDDGLPLISAHESGNSGQYTPTHRETFMRRITVEWDLFLAFLKDPVAQSMEEMGKRNASIDHGSGANLNDGEHDKHLSPMPVTTESLEAILPSFTKTTKSASFHTLPHEDPDHWQEMTILDIENVAAHPRHARVHTRNDMCWE